MTERGIWNNIIEKDTGKYSLVRTESCWTAKTGGYTAKFIENVLHKRRD